MLGHRKMYLLKERSYLTIILNRVQRTATQDKKADAAMITIQN